MCSHIKDLLSSEGSNFIINGSKRLLIWSLGDYLMPTSLAKLINWGGGYICCD